MRSQLTVRQLLVATAAVAGLSVCLWPVVWVFTCYMPVQSAAEPARRAADMGYRMEGYLGTIPSEPDAVGGCTVQFEFHDFSADPPQR